MPAQSPHNLTAVLCQAPALLEMLSSQDWAALSACGKQMRHAIHSSVTAVTVHEVSDAKAVMMGEWPQLALIKLQPKAPIAPWEYIHHAQLLQHSKFQLLATLIFCTVRLRAPFDTSTVIVVSPNGQLNQHSSIVAAFSHMRGLKWQHFSHLTATVYRQPEGVIAYMAQANWPCIEDLTFFHSTLDPASMHLLAKGSWPRLQNLRLSNCQLDTEAVTALIQVKRPMLGSLILGSDPSLSAVGSAVIPTAANWASLTCLRLVHFELNAACGHNIMLLHDQLKILDLACTDIDAVALSQIASSPWPHLQKLVLSGNKLQAGAIASLVVAHVPNLTYLCLENNRLDAVAARHLAKGRWPKLSCLAVDNNILDNAAMGFLATGDWPMLQTLRLHGNDINVQGLRLLSAGQWPQLCKLMLDGSAISIATWTLLNLSWFALPALIMTLVISQRQGM